MIQCWMWFPFFTNYNFDTVTKYRLQWQTHNLKGANKHKTGYNRHTQLICNGTRSELHWLPPFWQSAISNSTIYINTLRQYKCKASFCDDTKNIANVFCTLFCSFVYSFLNTEYNKRVMKDQWWKVNKTTKGNTLGTGSPVQSIQMQVYCFWDELCYLYLGWQAPFSKIMTSTEEKYLDLLSIFVCFIFLIQLDGTVWANGRVKKFLNLKLFPPQAAEICRKVNDNPKSPLKCNWLCLHPTSALVNLLLSDNAILCQLYKLSNMEKFVRPKW